MRACGIILLIIGAGGICFAFFMDSSVAGGGLGRVANLDLMNFKSLLATSGSCFFLSGCVLIGAASVCDTLRPLPGKETLRREPELHA